MTDPMTAPAAATASSIIEDMIDIFGSPSAVFARRAGRSAMAPFFTVLALFLALMFVNQGVMSNIMESQQATKTAAALQGKSLTADQLEQVSASQKTMAKFAFVAIAVVMPVTILLFALVAWLVGKPFGSTMSFGTALMVVSFAWLPKVVEQVLLSVQGMVLDTSVLTDPSQVTLGLARFLDHTTTSAAVMALAGRVDLIVLWGTFLLAAGYANAGKMERNKAWAAAATVWALGAVPMLAGALMTG